MRLGIGRTILPTRLWHLFYAGGHALLVAFGVAILLVVLEASRRVHRALPPAIAVAVLVPFAWMIFREDVEVFPRWGQLAFSVGAGLAMAVAAMLALRDGGRVARGAALLVGAAFLVANHYVLYVYYPGSHLAFAVLTLLAFATVIARLPIPRAVARPIFGHAATSVLALWAACTFVIPARARVIVALDNDESAVVQTFQLFAREERAALSFRSIGQQQMEWFLPRDGRPAVRPTPKRPANPRPLVVLVTIDAFRRDVFFDPARRAALPNLTALAAEGTTFTDARTTASSTSPAIASLFSGKYYAQRYWTPARIGQADRPFLQEDMATRFPELLSRRGIATGAFPSTVGLLQQYGVSRGFRHEHPFGDARNVTSDVLVDALVAWLPKDPRAAFAWMHMLDAHAPYVLGGDQGSAFERYVRELTIADALVGKLVAALRTKGLWERTLLIVTSDHGEAFDEHGSSFHGKNLYEEVARVPMVIAGGGVAQRTFDAPVSIIDLGPTILDAFTVATPGDFMGQSLLPVVLGETPTLTRPIAMDHSKGHQALVFADGIKVVCKRAASGCEIYDLTNDPREELNLADDREDARERIGAVNAFFEAHRLKKPGYELPTR